MSRGNRIISYTLIGIFAVVAVGVFYIGRVLGDPYSTINYNFFNNTVDSVYIMSSDIELYQNGLKDTTINETVYTIIPSMTEITLYQDHKVGFVGYYTLDSLNCKHDSLNILTNGRRKGITMTETKRYKLSIENDQNITFVRQFRSDEL